jgi:hypothetical protein
MRPAEALAKLRDITDRDRPAPPLFGFGLRHRRRVLFQDVLTGLRSLRNLHEQGPIELKRDFLLSRRYQRKVLSMQFICRQMRLVVAVAIVALALIANVTGPTAVGTASAQSGNSGPLKLVSCVSPSNGKADQSASAGAPSTGPDTATDASDGKVGTPLWCVSGISGGNAASPSDTSDCGGSGASGASVTTDGSTRGFGWVC